MPELPEVEITKRKLEPLIKGKRILNVNRKILGLERRGKAILIWLGAKAKPYLLAFHMRMSGKLLIVARNFSHKHIRRRFKLSDGRDLVLHDVRKFGVVWYGPAAKVLSDQYFSTLGPNALKISLRDFKKLFKPKHITPLIPLTLKGAKAKPFLLNQKNIAGIGNMMTDEILWHAKIYPEKMLQQLSNSEIEKLWKSMRTVLQKSIKLGGSTMRDWLHPDASEGGYLKKDLFMEERTKNVFAASSKFSAKK